MKLFFILLIILIFIGGCVQSETISEPIITSNGNEFLYGDIINVTLINTMNEPVYLHGCNQFFIERWTGEEWIGHSQLPNIACFFIGTAKRVDKNLTLEYVTDSIGFFRVRAEYGIGCDEDEPVGPDYCRNTSVIYSNEFEVKAHGIVLDLKDSYNLGEEIIVNVSNDFLMPIYLEHRDYGYKDYNNSFGVYKLSNGSWERVDIDVFCACLCEKIHLYGGCPMCYIYATGCDRFDKNMNFIWNQEFYYKDKAFFEGEQEDCFNLKNVERGDYKLEFCYHSSSNCDDLPVCMSREFEIN